MTLQNLIELKDQKNKETASQFYNSEQSIYKKWDYRCLVPYSDKDPTKWKTYDMHEYRRAVNKKTLKKVTQYRYDNNFYNWVDPKVLKYFTKNKNSMKRAWRKTYGLPYNTPMVWKDNHTNPADETKCFIKCAHYVRKPDHKGLVIYYIIHFRGIGRPPLPHVIL